MSMSFRWLAPLILSAGFGAAALAPAPVHASDDLVRVIVDVADVVLRGGSPYYRHGSYGHNDRLVMARDRHGRPVYYRQVPRNYRAGYHPSQFRGPPPHARARGHANNRGQANNRSNCDRNGRCTVRYYDPRFDRDQRGKRNSRGNRW
ncbi:hypothetical protein WCE55_09365 [Luteimonas sp. MJ293]|uniref:hypothetical protein n=1 Tax=Luteimonas sp. MJ146 TaxID=3129240 RepID=UPI0031BB43EE